LERKMLGRRLERVGHVDDCLRTIRRLSTDNQQRLESGRGEGLEGAHGVEEWDGKGQGVVEWGGKNYRVVSPIGNTGEHRSSVRYYSGQFDQSSMAGGVHSAAHGHQIAWQRANAYLNQDIKITSRSVADPRLSTG
jgi:hypothetical protein